MATTDYASSGTPVDIFFGSPGQMAARTRAFDWSATPLGPVESWSASLRTTVSTLLASRHAMWLWWGPELIQFYNDAYAPSLGPDRHPSALGARGRECWAEIWPFIGADIEAVMAGGPATWYEDRLVPITRGDRVHDVYWSYSFSPVRDDDGSVGGVLVTVQETTRRVVAERRAELLRRLAAAMLPARSAEEVCRLATGLLESAHDDLVFARIQPNGEAAPVAGGAPDGPAADVDTITVPLETAYGPPLALAVGLNPRLGPVAANGEFVELVAAEITRALGAVERVAEQVELLAGAFELAPAFLAILRGPGHVFEFVNPAYEQLVAYRDLIGKPVREALPEMTGQGYLEVLDHVYASGEPFVGNEVTVQLQPAPGAPTETRYLNVVYQQMRGSRGDVTGVLATGTDVTALVEARHRVEHALAETERVAAERDAERRQLRTVIEQAPLAIAIISATGEIRFANPTFERLWGRPAENTSAATYSDAYTGYHLDGRPIQSEEWAGARAVLHGEIVEGEVIEIVQAGERGQPGRRLTVWISAAPVRDADGGITGGVVMFRDITAERLTEQQLRDAQRLQAVGTLAGGVAHEVNNALQGTLGFGSFVLEGLGPGHPLAPDMRLVLQSAERAAQVSQQLLAYARQQVTRPQAVDLPALTAGLRPVLQQLLGADKSLVLVPPSAPVPPIEADPAQVEQVLINLVANARDALDTGGRVTIAIGAEAVDAAAAETSPTADLGFHLPPGPYVRMSVADDGHGMSPATLAHIFDPFFTTKPVGEGTGLGLSMVYGTVKQHGGYVGARSALGEGTTMELYWPAAPRKAAAGNATAGVPETRYGTRARIVLVADDEPMVRTLLSRTLAAEGYEVIAAEDGAAALELLDGRQVRPDLVVTDVIMPRLNGRQLHDAALARWPGLPVLFISGHTGDQAVLQRLVPAGAPFLQKPFSPAELAQTAGRLMADPRRR